MTDEYNKQFVHICEQLCEKGCLYRFQATGVNENQYHSDVNRLDFQQQRSYAALEKCRTLYLQLYEFAPVAYLTLSEQGLISQANVLCATLFGVNCQKLINQQFSQYVVHADCDRWYRYYLLDKKIDQVITLELTLLRPDRTCFQALLHCLYREENNSTPRIYVTFTDITEIKQAQQAQRIEAFAFASQVAIVVTDEQQVVVRVNPAFSRLTGYDDAEVVGHKPSFLRSEMHDDKFYRSLWEGLRRDGYWQGELWDKHRNGELFPIWFVITAIIGINGGVTHYVGYLVDISALKKAEKNWLDSRDTMENQVVDLQMELAENKKESTDINATLDILHMHREAEISHNKIALSNAIENTILPCIEKLKRLTSAQNQVLLVNSLEISIQQLVKSYGSSATLPGAYVKLTPSEMQVAELVRQGQSTKLIAATLNLSAGTISTYRKHIRKKLQVEGKASNLYSYLKLLEEE